MSDDRAFYPTSQGERRYPAECSHPGHKELQPHSFCPDSQLMATVETFAFWLSALFTTTGRTKVHNTAATRTIRLLLSCSMLLSLVNKTPRYFNSSSLQCLSTSSFSDRGLWNPGMVLASLLLKKNMAEKDLHLFGFESACHDSFNWPQWQGYEKPFVEEEIIHSKHSHWRDKTSVPVTSPCRCPFVVLCICSFYKHALQHPDPLPWIDV